MKRVLPATITVALVIALPQAVHHLTRGGTPTPADAVVAAAPSHDATPQTFTTIAHTGVAIAVPSGYETHPERPGIKHAETDASLLIFNLPEPFATVAARFEPDAMASRGLTFGSRENVQVDGRSAILVTASQELEGKAYEKLLTIVADDGRTLLLSATLPKDQLDTLSLPLEQAMLTARLDAEDTAVGGPPSADALSDLPMRISPSEGFRLAARDENSAVLTRDGQTPTASPDRATFALGVEPVKGRVIDRRGFAEQRLAFTQGVRDILVYSGNYASVAGLPAYEIVATARFTENDAPCFIQQTLVFDDGRVYVLQGVATMAAGQPTLTAFQTMTGSLRLQTPRARPTLSSAGLP